MDAYDLHQELFKAWQMLAHKPDAGLIKKIYNETPVYLDDGRKIVDIKIEDNRIVLKTK